MEKLTKRVLIPVPKNLQFYWKNLGYPDSVGTSPYVLILFDNIKVIYNSDIMGELKIKCNTDMVKITYEVLDFLLLPGKNNLFQFKTSFYDKNDNLTETVELSDKKLFKEVLLKKATSFLNYWVEIHISIKIEAKLSNDAFIWINALEEWFEFYTIDYTVDYD